MAPAPNGGFVDEQQLERELARQMGCMAGFFQLFNRHQLLTGKRIHSTRSLPSSPAPGSSSPSGRSETSLASTSKDNYPSPPTEPCPSSPESRATAEVPPRPSLPLPLPVFDSKDGLRPWKLREAPRLSLDSRAVVDGKGKLRPRETRTAVSVPSRNQSDISEKQRRNPSVVARLMGLDALPDAGSGGGGVNYDRAELRRSASESRVPRDLSYYRFVDSSSFEKAPPPEPKTNSTDSLRRANVGNFRHRTEAKKTDPAPRTASLPPLQRKSYFDAGDFFPEPKKSGPLHVNIDKRLQKRGIDEPVRDLETLKQILEALQLKGLLHSEPSDQRISARRNIIYDDNSRISAESQIVVMKPAPKPPRRPSSEPPTPSPRSMSHRRNSSRAPESTSPIRRDRAADLRLTQGNDKKNRTPMLSETPARRRPSNSAEVQKTPQPQRKISSVNSPKSSTKKVGPDPVTVRSTGNRPSIMPERMFQPAEEDTATTISESSVGSSSQFDFERSRSEDYRSSRNLLDRCDKLLNSITAFTVAGEQVSAADHQPSPVSVLDSSPYLGGGECSSSPAIKRSIDFKDPVDWEDQWNESTPTVGSSHGDESPEVAEEEEEFDDADFAYVSRILRASLDGDFDSSDDVFAALEKRRYASDTSDAARLHRRLVFDTVEEILDRKRHLSPWVTFARARSLSSAVTFGGRIPPLRQVWAEVRRIKEQAPADDLNDVTCGDIMKDMAGDHIDGGLWGAKPAADMSDAVLFIERQVFKDLVAEAIRELADVAATSWPVPRRKLVF